MVIGIELSDEGSRIACLNQGMEMPESLSQTVGGDNYVIPAVVALKRGEEDFRIGIEAQRIVENDGAQKAEKLLEKSLKGDVVVLYGRDYDAVELLHIYLVRLLSLTALIMPWQSADRICICCGELGNRMVELLRSLVSRLDYPSEQVDIISRSESFYEYVMHQKEELYNHDVLLLDCMGRGVTSRRMSVDRKLRPAVTRTFTESDESFDALDDEAFMHFCEKQTEGRIITSVFIAGERITRDALPRTMRFLCMKRRVFYAHNVYAKGACHAAADRAAGYDRRRSYLYLGKDKLRSNVGLKVNRVHDEVYVSLVDAGVNWYDVRTRTEIYLGREKEIRLLISPLTGRNEHYAIVRLSDIPSRPEHTSRVRIFLTMESEDYLTITVEDLGFGEIFPASGIKITERIPVGV